MEIGDNVGSYRVVRRLGEGGMGAVYEALNEAIERRVAIKVLHPSFARDQATVTRFFNEARAVNRIAHPSLVQIHEHGYQPDGTAYIVMELLDGETLSDRLRRSRAPLTLEATLHITWQIAHALAAAHDKSIVHRDLKPSNIMLVADPLGLDGQRAKVLDFGIAKLASAGAIAANTATHAVLGTPLYMAPEQCRGAASVDGKADVYSLGCILFELVAGRPPFTIDPGTSPLALLNLHLSEPIPSLARLAPLVPTAVIALVERMLAKDAAQRPTMQEVAAELGRMIGVSSNPNLAHAATLAAATTAADASLALAATQAESTAPPPGVAPTPAATMEPAPRRRASLLAIPILVVLAAGVAWKWQARSTSSPERSTPSASVTATAPVDAGPASADASTPSAAAPLALHCNDLEARPTGNTQCPPSFLAWCTPEGRKLGCCASGLVPIGEEGLCACPPGGVSKHTADGANAACPVHPRQDARRDELKATVSQLMPAVHACLDQAIEENPALRGKVYVRWWLSADGSVHDARIHASSFPSPLGQACLLRVLRGARFSPPPDGVEMIVYPFTLKN